MAEYTIAAIPTQYRGRMYRSRLEARWAAFFDRLGWTHEYEPFDMGKWSPDFAITEPFNALIEVKPAISLDEVLAERIDTAGDVREMRIITRVSPEVTKNGGGVVIGWWSSSLQPASLAWIPRDDRPRFEADIFSFSYDCKVWMTASGRQGEVGDGSNLRLWSYPDHAMSLWNDACNSVQWEPAR